MRAALAAEGNLGLPPTRALVEEALAFCSLCDDYLDVPDHALAAVRERYVAAPRRAGALDYGGLQREAVALLERDDDARRAYADGFRYVLVDEYQDTNVAQERLLELIAGEHRNVFCVADEDQSIYGFRGAEIENTLGFEERWPGAARYDLPTNYRSAPPIVELGDERHPPQRRHAPRQGADARPRTARPSSPAAPSATPPRRPTGSRARSPRLRLDGVAARRDRRARPLAAARSGRGSPTRSAATASRSTRRSPRRSTRPPTRCSR